MSSDINMNCEEANILQPKNEKNMNKTMKKTLFVLNCIMLGLGNTGGPLLLRLYFLRGGKRRWLSSWLETGGWPIVIFPLAISYFQRHRINPNAKAYFTTPIIFVACMVLGILTGLDDYMYAYGMSYLPVSTSALLISSQLGFQALFAFLIVRHKFTPYSINSVVLLTVGAVILGLHSAGDRPTGESRHEYYIGFFLTLGAAALYGGILPLIELAYMKAKQAITYTLVMEMQLVMGFFATAFATIGMLFSHDFKVIPREAREGELSEAQYYMLLVAQAIFWQLFFLGAVGVIATSSSLHAGVLIAVHIPVTEILAVIFFKESFKPEKGISLGLALWGLASYFYGEYINQRNENKNEKIQA